MKVIGVIGLNGSGKDELVKYLNKRYGIPLISVGDIVREIAANEGIEPTRENLDDIAKRYFAQYGEGYFLKLIAAKICQNRIEAVGISGVRSPKDVAIMKDAFKGNFILINIYVTDPHVRYQRIRERGSERDQITYEEFLQEDQVSDQLFHIQEAVKMADYSLPNDSTLEDLHQEIEKLIIEKNILGQGI